MKQHTDLVRLQSITKRGALPQGSLRSICQSFCLINDCYGPPCDAFVYGREERRSIKRGALPQGRLRSVCRQACGSGNCLGPPCDMFGYGRETEREIKRAFVGMSQGISIRQLCRQKCANNDCFGPPCNAFGYGRERLVNSGEESRIGKRRMKTIWNRSTFAQGIVDLRSICREACRNRDCYGPPCNRFVGKRSAGVYGDNNQVEKRVSFPGSSPLKVHCRLCNLKNVECLPSGPCRKFRNRKSAE